MKQTAKIECFSNHPDALHSYLTRLQEIISREGALNHIHIESELEEDGQDPALNQIGKCEIKEGKSFSLNNSNHLLEQEIGSSSEAGSGIYLIHMNLDESMDLSAHDLLEKVVGVLEKQLSEKGRPDFQSPQVFILFHNTDEGFLKSKPDKTWIRDSEGYHTTFQSKGLNMVRELNMDACGKLESIGLTDGLKFGIYKDSWGYPSTQQFINALFLNFALVLDEWGSLEPMTFNQKTDCIEAMTFRSHDQIDLQIAVIGDNIGDRLFAALIRNVTERWEIRYNATVSRIQFKDTEDSYLLRIRNLPDIPGEYTINIINCNDQLGPQVLSRDFIDARKNVFLWMIADQNISPALDDHMVEHPLYDSFLTVGELINTLKRSEPERASILHIYRFYEVISRYGLKPWANLHPENELLAAEAVNRNAPKLYRNLVNTTEDVRFHSMPYSPEECHLDASPGWIDKLILEHLKNA